MENNSKINFEDFSKICRLCLAYGELLPILSSQILYLVTTLTNIPIEEDQMPENICKKCIKHLEDIALFINTCRSNNEILKSIIEEECSKQDTYSSEEFDNETSHSGDEIKVEIPDNRNYTVKSECANNNEIHAIEFVRIKLECSQPFLCNFCGKNYTSKNGFDRHMLSHTGIKSFECEECGKRFMTKDTLKKHLVTHTGVKAYKCNICGKCFTQSSHLSHHNKRHTGEKPHKCNLCGKGFLSVYHLNRHKIIHSGVKPFECNECGKQFVQNVTLQEHLLSHNVDQKEKLVGKKKYLCTICGKSFTAVGTLNIHIRIHTGETPYTCSYCNISYNNSSSLRRHVMRKHTGEKPHVCHICNKAYHDSTNLKRHLKKTHDDADKKVNMFQQELR